MARDRPFQKTTIPSTASKRTWFPFASVREMRYLAKTAALAKRVLMSSSRLRTQELYCE